MQTHRAYPDFVRQFDELAVDCVRWWPYIEDEVLRRAPLGLSVLCVRDREYWLTTRALIFDIYVKESLDTAVWEVPGMPTTVQ